MSEKDARARQGTEGGRGDAVGSHDDLGALGTSRRAAAVQVVTDAAPDDDVITGDVAASRGPSLRMRVGVGAAIVLVIAALVASVLITALSPLGSTTVFGGREEAAATPTPTGATAPAAPPPRPDDVEGGSRATVLVHLLGAVVHPGVYELAEGARVVDAVGRAGGFAPQADQASVNLARLLTDGEQVRVLATGEAPPAAAASGGGGDGGGGAGGTGAVGSGDGAGSGNGSGALVNLNSATELDLDALPRIGPAMAARIVAWRTDNGPFTAVDDLLEVAGIGEKTLEGLRPLVTV